MPLKAGKASCPRQLALNPAIRFGCHLFVNPEDSWDTIRRALREMRSAGFELIRLFLPWSHLEPSPGVCRWSPYEEIFEESEVLGLKIVATLMSVSPPGWMNMTHGLQDVADLDDPEFLARSLFHLRTVVDRWKNHPALDSWILWNEPCRGLRQGQATTWEAYRRYLETVYGGDIDAYNRDHFRPATSFAGIVPPLDTAYATGFASHRAEAEWLRFTVENLQEKLVLMADEVRRLDPHHPLHVNPHKVSQCLADLGQSIWREADTVDFIGCSAHPAWHSVRFTEDRYGDSIALFGDLARSASRAADGYFWTTELQGGTTLMSAFRPLAATPEEARLWLWQALGSGSRAVVYWCANARSDGYEAGEWDLLDQAGSATPRLQEISRTIRRLKPHLDALGRAGQPRPDVGILVVEDSQILDLVEGSDDDPGNPRNRQKGTDAASGAYLLAADLSLEVVFFETGRFLERPVSSLPRILIVPNVAVIGPDIIARLAAAAAAGCLVIGDGFFAWKDRHGGLADSLRKPAALLWGGECVGYEAVAETRRAVDGRGVPLEGWFCRAMFKAKTAEIISFWEDGLPACLKHGIGKGACVRIGTQFFQRYFTHCDSGARQWFWRLVQPFLPPAHRLENPGPGLRLRRLSGVGGESVGILINSSREPRAARIHRPHDPGAALVVEVPPQDARVVRLGASHDHELAAQVEKPETGELPVPHFLSGCGNVPQGTG